MVNSWAATSGPTPNKAVVRGPLPDDGCHLPVEGGDLLGEGRDPAGEPDQGCGGGVFRLVKSGRVTGQRSVSGPA